MQAPSETGVSGLLHEAASLVSSHDLKNLILAVLLCDEPARLDLVRRRLAQKPWYCRCAVGNVKSGRFVVGIVLESSRPCKAGVGLRFGIATEGD